MSRLKVDDIQEYLFGHPVLLEPDVQERLRKLAATSADRQRLESFLDILGDLAIRLDRGEMPYVIGDGPVERVAFRIRKGEMTSDSGRTLVQSHDTTIAMGPAYVHRLLQMSNKLLYQGDWELSLLILDLLWHALGSWQSPEAPRLRVLAGIDLVQTTARALMDTADGRLYKSALAIGTSILEEARKEPKDTEIIAEVTRRLGVLHLDPYTANRSAANFEGAHRAWLRSVENLPDRYASDSEELRMPEVKEALQRAEEYLREAVAFSSGPMRGLNLKALVQTLGWRDFFEEPVSSDEIARLCREAAELIDASEDPQALLFVQNMLRRLGAESASREDLRNLSVDDLLEQHGPQIAIDTIKHAAEAMEGEDALALLIRARKLFEEHADDGNRTSRWMLMLNRLPLFDPELPERLERKSFEEAAAILEAAATERDASPRAHALALASYAFRTSAWDGEAEGLRAVAAARELLDAKDAEELHDLLTYLEAALGVGVGSNNYNASRYGEAMTAYAAAFRCAAETGLASMASELLGRMDDLFSKINESPELIGEMTKALIGTVVPVALMGDPAASELVRKSIKHAIAAAATVGAPAVVVALLVQMAKGVILRSILADGYDRDALTTPAVAELLSDIAALAPEADAGHTDASIVSAWLLSSWVSDLEIESGRTPQEQLLNLKRRFDRELYTRLMSLTPMRVPPLIPPTVLQNALADDAVFVDFYLGATPGGNVGLFTMLLAKDEPIQAQFIDQNFPDSRLILGEDSEQRVIANPLAMIVESMRTSVLDEPGRAVASREALESLSAYLRGFFGHLAPELERLSGRGKRVLYLAPHGPLHYVPFHLVGGETPLADSWTVVSVPNLGLAFRGLAENEGSEAAVIGLEFTPETNRFDLEPLQEAATEVRRIASVMGVEPVLETAATKERVIAELSLCRFIHIATHGEMEPNAAAFQTLYLAPDGDSDGRLYAHEILHLDLDHIELVTLSACETALGRFDADDNLRGLAANLFLAGAHAVIGTLWPAETESAAHFFETLYAELGNGASVLDAYRAAQVSTRDEYPAYRDWGAFYLMRSPVDRALPLMPEAE